MVDTPGVGPGEGNSAAGNNFADVRFVQSRQTKLKKSSMKKILLTLVLSLGIVFTSIAGIDIQQENGLFKRGPVHKTENVEKGTKQEAPVGSGVALLLTMGGCYAFLKSKKHE